MHQAMDTDITCPRTFECSGNRTSFDIGRIPSYIAITSSCFSCLGSLLIIFVYLTLKDMRTGAQKIITLLAIADFFTASGHIVGSTNYLVHFNDTNEKSCGVFEIICEIQSSVSTWSSMCSYCWTCILAFYFLLVLVYNKASLAGRLIPLYNIIAWLSPLTIVIPLLATGKLGYAPYAASTWCFIKVSTYSSNVTKLPDKHLTAVLVLLAGQLWQMITYLLVLIVYMVIRGSISKTLNRINIQRVNVPEVGGVEKRLLAIPLLFIFLRIWGTVQFFFSLGVSGTNKNGCIPNNIHLGFFILDCLEAVGDSGQGWGNAVLYIFLSPKIRTRLFCDPCQVCLRVCGRKLQAVGQRLSSVGVHRLDESPSTSSSQPQHAGPGEQRSRGTASASSTSRGRSEPSEGAGPSETSEPAPPVPISVVPGYRTVLVKN